MPISIASHPPSSGRLAGIASLRRLDALYPVAGVLAVAFAVEAVARLELLPSRYFPPTTTVVADLWELLPTGTFWSSVLDTLQGWAIGLGLATAAAVPIGLLLGTSTFAYRGTRVIVEVLRPVPSVALIPLAILVFDRGLVTKVFLVGFGAFWPVLVHTTYGARGTEPLALATARAFRIPRLTTFVKVVLPSALPSIATGVRIASAFALMIAVTVEIVIGAPGLGQQIVLSQSGGDPARMYVYVLATGLVGLAIALVFGRVERRLMAPHLDGAVGAGT